MPKLLPLPEIGSRFGRLTVIEIGLHMPPTKSQAAANRPGNRAVLTRCDCGAVKLARLYTMRSGRTLSCGCIKREQTLSWWADPDYIAAQKERGGRILTEKWADPAYAEAISKQMTKTNRKLWADPKYADAVKARAAQRMTTHGLSRHPLYSTHAGMMSRCYTPTANGYQNYGGRGIRVFADWHLPEIAVLEMAKILGPRPPGTTLDRIDNNDHYRPGNIRWATRRDQQLNIGHGPVAPLQDGCNRGSDCRCGG